MKREEKTRIINDALEEYLSLPEKERSLTKIGRKYGVKRQTLSKYLKDRGIEVINYQNRLRIDETVFNVIDTDEKAYWLGFIYADGNISSTGYRFEINLSVKDLAHMLKLKNFLKYEEDIRFSENNGHPACRLAVRNKNLWQQLNNKGCVPNKSLILKFPDLSIFKTQDLVWSFIRGYFDGDGCCYVSPDNHCCVKFVSTKEFLKSLQEFVGLSITNKIRNKSCTNWKNKAFRLDYGKKNDIIIFYHKFYSNAQVYLGRKRNKFEDYLKITAPNEILK